MNRGEPFTLALGGGGGRGWAHVGVARALDEAGMHPGLIVGTSMGALVGAALAAGVTPAAVEAAGRRTAVYRILARPGRFAMFDPRPLLERMAADLGDPAFEELPTPLAVTSYDLVAGRPTAITSGRVMDAVRRSISVPLFFPPCADASGVWCDAGGWESVPVSHARRLSSNPVIGVWVDVPKPPFLAWQPISGAMRLVSRGLMPEERDGPLTARRYLALLTSRMSEPVVELPPDVEIRPALGLMPAWEFGRVASMSRRGYEEARRVLASLPAKAAKETERAAA